MKKFFIITLLTLPALSIHGMGLLLKDEATKTGIVHRPFATVTPNAPSTQAEQLAPEAPAVLNEASASLRPTNPSYRSFDRASIALDYPADDDHQWDIVTTHDIKEAFVMEKAQETLMQAQNLVPDDLKSYIHSNIHTSENPLKDLETARELIWACITRIEPNFATLYTDTLTKNFGPCKEYDPNFNPSNAYAYFAYDKDVGMQEPNDTFADLIKEKLKKACNENDEKTQWFMRQFGFMFRDAATKQAYDAYLKGGQEALKKLILPAEKANDLQACLDSINDAKYELKELHKKAQNKN